MAYDQDLARRVRAFLDGYPDVQERRMFGGLAFMISGHMCCGVLGSRLMVRVGPGGYQEALRRTHARVMDFTGRPLKGMIYVEPPGTASDADLSTWLLEGINFASGLPPKDQSGSKSQGDKKKE